MENKLWWIFTFGSGQEHAGYYVKIYGTWSEARKKMFEKYGEKWSFQYSEAEWENWKLNCPPYLTPEKELETIS